MVPLPEIRVGPHDAVPGLLLGVLVSSFPWSRLTAPKETPRQARQSAGGFSRLSRKQAFLDKGGVERCHNLRDRQNQPLFLALILQSAEHVLDDIDPGRRF